MHGKKIAVNLIWKFTERIGVQLTNLIIQMVLARIIIPEAFAAVAIIMVFVNIATIIVQSGLGSALIQKKEVSEEDYYCFLYKYTSVCNYDRYYVQPFTIDCRLLSNARAYITFAMAVVNYINGSF